MEKLKSTQDAVSQLDPEITSNPMGAGSKWQPPRFGPIEGIENLERYAPGGYHPIALGDALHDGRYSVIDKLGHGGHSTIWVARDNLAGGYVAVKIGVSDSTLQSQETEIMRKLLESDDDRASMILPILDEFVLSGPNGQHPCIVTALARMSIARSKQVRYDRSIFPIPTARAIVAQLAQAVAFCHKEGIVHGDLHTGNILLCFPPDDNIHTLALAGFYDRFRAPWQEPVEEFRGGPAPLVADVPAHGVIAQFLGGHPKDVTLVESAVLLADFGESYMPSSASQRTYSHAPPGAKPPEAHFAPTDLGFPADIWALACAIWEVVAGGFSLFRSDLPPTDDNLRFKWVRALGRLPDQWWAAWDCESRHESFTEDGLPRAGPPHLKSPLPGGPGLELWFEHLVQDARREVDMEPFEDEEKGALLKMLKAMLAYQPADRISAEDVLSTEWMLRWGVPALDELRKSRKAPTTNGPV